MSNNIFLYIKRLLPSGDFIFSYNGTQRRYSGYPLRVAERRFRKEFNIKGKHLKRVYG